MEVIKGAVMIEATNLDKAPETKWNKQKRVHRREPGDSRDGVTKQTKRAAQETQIKIHV